MNSLLNKARGRNPLQIVAGIGRIIARELRLRAEERKAGQCDYLQLDALPSMAAREGKVLIEKWCQGAGAKLDNYLLACASGLENDEFAQKTLLRSASEIVAGRFYVYGKTFDLGKAPEWNLDIAGSGSWPRRFVRRYRFPDKGGQRGDYRHVWELNRQQHLVLLALAWRITQDDRFVDTIIGHITSWIEQNPVYYSMNWASSMEVSLRIISWIAAISLVRESAVLDSEKLCMVIKGIVQHQRYLHDNLSIDLVQKNGPVKLRNNHTIVELCGLLLCAPFAETVAGEKPQRPIKQLQSSLLAEISMQAYPDGMSVEQSSSYQRFSLEAILATALASNDDEFRQALAAMAEKHLSALLALRITEDRFVLVGDEDNGHALVTRPSARPDDPTEARDMFAALSGHAFPVSQCVSVLPDSGHWCWRGVLNKQSVVIYFRAGKMDFPNIPGYAPHAQCDLLSFCLYVNGKPVLVDSGTYSYHDSVLRNKFRLSRAHNTLCVKGMEQMRILGPFSADNHANASIVECDDSSVAGEMSLMDNERKAKVRRSLSVDPAAQAIVISDSIETSSGCEIEWYLNMHPDFTIAKNGHVHGGNIALRVNGLPNPVGEASCYSPEYGVLLPAHRLVAHDSHVGPGVYQCRWTLELHGTHGK